VGPAQAPPLHLAQRWAPPLPGAAAAALWLARSPPEVQRGPPWERDAGPCSSTPSRSRVPAAVGPAQARTGACSSSTVVVEPCSARVGCQSSGWVSPASLPGQREKGPEQPLTSSSSSSRRCEWAGLWAVVADGSDLSSPIYHLLSKFVFAAEES